MNETTPQKRGLGCFGIAGLMLLTIVLSVGVTFWLVKTQLFPAPFEPVALDRQEQQTLQDKLDAIGLGEIVSAAPKANDRLTQTQRQESAELTPEPYTEDPERRNISLSEKELNALLANNTDLAQRLVIDLADNMASAKLLVHLDPDFPFIGGKTLKVSAGTEIAFEDGKPVIVLKGVSVWGVPVPNAWLGGMKNVDLVEQFGDDGGFWQGFADGIADIRVSEGELHVRLRE
ncbi:hypothetical protein Q4485_07940 [Granulosicoccaceae sp. 1_MG-2023]|nr:hypothetical protein [Granulosicoccaceae sp. 1_MG-2023]